MRWVFFGLLLVHGSIHFMGFAKAFGLAELPQLTQPISKGLGLVWLITGFAFVLSAVMLIATPSAWWAVGAISIVLSQVIVIYFWSDAKFGTLANILIFLGVVYGFVSLGPISFSAEYRQLVDNRLRTIAPSSILTESDLLHLPEPVKRYVKLSGAIGRPRIQNFRARWKGRIRASADEPWMQFSAEQFNFVKDSARFFKMEAFKSGLAVDVLHVYDNGTASMRVKLLSLFDLVDLHGLKLDRAETVTVLNDLSILAPGALANDAIEWEPVDSRSARAKMTVGANTISALLIFNDAGELVDFISDDRLRASSDGTTLMSQRWSTPLYEYRNFGPFRVASRGKGVWHEDGGDFTYLEMELVDLDINTLTF